MSNGPGEARRIDVGSVLWRVFAIGTAAIIILFGIIDQSWWTLCAGGCYLIFCLWVVLKGLDRRLEG